MKICLKLLDYIEESGRQSWVILKNDYNRSILGPTIKACKVLGVQFATAVHFLLNLRARKKLQLPMALAKLEKLSSYGRYNKRIIEDATERLKGAKGWA